MGKAGQDLDSLNTFKHDRWVMGSSRHQEYLLLSVGFLAGEQNEMAPTQLKEVRCFSIGNLSALWLMLMNVAVRVPLAGMGSLREFASASASASAAKAAPANADT